jgi:hypothetical protein
MPSITNLVQIALTIQFLKLQKRDELKFSNYNSLNVFFLLDKAMNVTQNFVCASQQMPDKTWFLIAAEDLFIMMS